MESKKYQEKSIDYPLPYIHLFLFQVWPQYRAARILYFGLRKKDPTWKSERKLHKQVTSVEPFTESVPMILFQLFLGATTLCVGPTNFFGVVTFGTSIISASYGLTNFLRVGPLKAIPDYPFSGHGHLSFWLIFLSIATSLVTKGLASIYTGFCVFWCEKDKQFTVTPESVGIGFCLMFLPQILLSVTTLLATVGFKNFIKLTLRYPALILLSVFTPFTFGPTGKSCCVSADLGKVGLNHFYTAMNMILSLGQIGTTFFAGNMFVLNFWGSYCATILFTTFFILCDLCNCYYLPRKLKSLIKPEITTKHIELILDESEETSAK